jgi:hypothetical protein
MKKITKEEALAYHTGKRHGKTEVVPTKPCITQRDLSLAYTPGVAEPCLEIARDAELVYEYTNKGNLVAVVSNGTAVLGLGDIGPMAGKPVMEGKGVLFKRFADIDVFDIEVDSKDPEEIIRFSSSRPPSAASTSRTSARPSASRSRNDSRRVVTFRSSTTISTGPRSFRALLSSTLSRWPEKKSKTSRWCSRAPARRESPAPPFMSHSVSSRKTS